MSLLQPAAYTLSSQAGENLRLFGLQVSVKATGEQTGGAFNLFDVSCPPDYATPLHIHYAEDVALFVLEGALTFYCGDEKMDAPAGSYLYQPRGTPHGFRVRDAGPARILYLTVPAGLDQLVTQRGRAAQDSGLTAAARYGIEIIGPLPE